MPDLILCWHGENVTLHSLLISVKLSPLFMGDKCPDHNGQPTPQVFLHIFLSFSCLCPCPFHVCCTYCAAFARGQAVSCCFPVISDLPSEIEHCKIVQVDIAGVLTEHSWETFYMLWNTFSCACQQPSSWKIGTELQVQGLRQPTIWTNQINKMN